MLFEHLRTLRKYFKIVNMYNLGKSIKTASAEPCRPTYQSTDFSLEECRQHLAKFTGGLVELNLDENTGIATVILNNPEKKNAITGSMMVDLENILTRLETWKTGKGLLIHGVEHNFCSGGDLNFAQQTGSAEGGYKMAKFMQNVLTRLQQLPLVSVAFIEGISLGGGSEVAISCDFRLFANDGALGFVHARMGIIPAWGGLTTAIQTLGYRTAMDLVTTARVVQVDEAQRLGLCDSLVGDLKGAREWLEQHTKYDASVIQSIKCVAHNTRVNGFTDDSLDFEKRVFAPLWGGPANKLALSQKIKHK